MFAPTYTGYIDSTEDALLVFEACRLGILQRRSRRLVESERKHVQSGSVFVWDETEAGIRRWTDGRRWSPSRVSGCFLIYTELEPKPVLSSSTTTATDIPLENGLIKKALSLYTTNQNKLHLVCYYDKKDLDAGKLGTPTGDSVLSKIPITRSLYPEVIPEMVQTLPVRQTQTIGARRSSVTLAALPVDIHQSLSVQQIRRQPTADDLYSPRQVLARRLSTHKLPISVTNPMENAVSESNYVVNPSAISSSAPLMMPPSRRCMTTTDSKEKLRSSLLQNITAHSAATQAPVSAQTEQAAVSGSRAASGLRPSSASFRSLSHPFLLDNSDLPSIKGSSTAPGSRRSTIYTPMSDNDGGFETESDNNSKGFRLPPISELLNIANRKSTAKTPVSSASVTAAVGSAAVERARMKYTGNPWDRQPHGMGTPQSLANYSLN
ncbi:Gluconate transport-inducing protein [Coemansia sp. IMI 203386]|nr:Gluconate transport-inducing protein [Coemansia sp. IMI 203386]